MFSVVLVKATRIPHPLSEWDTLQQAAAEAARTYDTQLPFWQAGVLASGVSIMVFRTENIPVIVNDRCEIPKLQLYQAGSY